MGEQAVTGEAGAAPAPEPDAGTAPQSNASAAPGPEASTAPQSNASAAPGPEASTAPEPDAGTAGGGAASRTADIVPGPGGVMTDEVGVVTGELTLRTEYADGQVALRVQYREADEWYAVTGGRAPLADPAGLDAVHTIAVGLLDRPEG
ncbi:hypothetical protein [Micromonospora carbonacea]|uniref:Uncharacterized protein n=1 Tax=Micromonospora carbonacea TaxID=47853 RepID=A0A1C4TWQ9_9ACTN|nr:hypothetical protein [Micromonospora carbonacea]SCE63799.1 hypothetical protein GA0070563_10139 [Micromonospora carbonacea]